MAPLPFPSTLVAGIQTVRLMEIVPNSNTSASSLQGREPAGIHSRGTAASQLLLRRGQLAAIRSLSRHGEFRRTGLQRLSPCAQSESWDSPSQQLWPRETDKQQDLRAHGFICLVFVSLCVVFIRGHVWELFPSFLSVILFPWVQDCSVPCGSERKVLCQ